jgi:hypothetical protein
VNGIEFVDLGSVNFPDYAIDEYHMFTHEEVEDLGI